MSRDHILRDEPDSLTSSDRLRITILLTYTITIISFEFLLRHLILTQLLRIQCGQWHH
jgi:hypothetical protein